MSKYPSNLVSLEVQPWVGMLLYSSVQIGRFFPLFSGKICIGSCRAALGRRRDPGGAHNTLEPRPSRGADYPAQADQAADVRSRQLRPAPPARSPGGMIHANGRRATLRTLLRK